jgi:hypothetical protein
MVCQLPTKITDSYSVISIIPHDDNRKCTVSVLQFSFPALLQAIYSQLPAQKRVMHTFNQENFHRIPPKATATFPS